MTFPSIHFIMSLTYWKASTDEDTSGTVNTELGKRMKRHGMHKVRRAFLFARIVHGGQGEFDYGLWDDRADCQSEALR